MLLILNKLICFIHHNLELFPLLIYAKIVPNNSEITPNLDIPQKKYKN